MSEDRAKYPVELKPQENQSRNHKTQEMLARLLELIGFAVFKLLEHWAHFATVKAAFSMAQNRKSGCSPVSSCQNT